LLTLKKRTKTITAKRAIIMISWRFIYTCARFLCVPSANLGGQLRPAIQALLCSLLTTELSHTRRARLEKPDEKQNR
jgi:hypothetical protein